MKVRSDFPVLAGVRLPQDASLHGIQHRRVGAAKGEQVLWGLGNERRDKRAHIAPRLRCWFSCVFSFSQQCSAPSGNVCRPCFPLLHRAFSHIGGSDGARE